jgi:hypothetical protein
VIDLIAKASKAARLILNSLVKLMNNDPELWGLANQSFAKSGAEMTGMIVSEGVETAYAAGEGAALNGDAAGGVTGRIEGQTETDPSKIAASMAKEKSTEETAFGAGETALGVGTDIATDQAKDSIIKGKKEKTGVARPRVTTKAVEAAAKASTPLGTKVVNKSEELVKEAATPEISNPQILTAAIDKQTTELSTEGTDSEAISKKLEEANTKKEEAKLASDVSGGINEVGTRIVKYGKVATRVAEINESIKKAKEAEELRATQRGGGKKK